MKIAIIGTGYVGLVTGACLAEVGNEVLCMDVDARKVDILKSGGIPIYEPGLEEMVRRNIAAGRLTFTTDAKASARFGEIQFIAVGTPPDEDGSADLQYVVAAARNIGRHMDSFKLVVNKSTVPVGTADRVKAAIEEELKTRGLGPEFCVASNPEFLKEGAAVDDFMKPDRIVIGTDNERATQLLRNLYAPFQRNHDRLIAMDIHSAELTKYAANAMLATRISFMNELAVLAENLGADIEQVRHGIGADPRIGYHFLYAGCGYGGSCFPKDVQALAMTADQFDYDFQILKTVMGVNDRQKVVLATKIENYFKGDLQDKTIAIWGLAFKPNTDDIREAPALYIIDQLLEKGAAIRAYDPEAMDHIRKIYGERITLCANAYDVLDGADALAIITEWSLFRSPDFEEMRRRLKAMVIFDGRNVFDLEDIRPEVQYYESIGRHVIQN